MTLSETPALLLLAPACLAGWCICPLTQCRKSVVQECAALSICQPACRARAHDPTKFVVSPITGELIPVDQMSEHMRVSMIDPRFQEQRNAMLAKIRDTTKAGDDEISRNLMTLAKKRPDVFGELSAVQGSVRQSFGCHPTFLLLLCRFNGMPLSSSAAAVCQNVMWPLQSSCWTGRLSLPQCVLDSRVTRVTQQGG